MACAAALGAPNTLAVAAPSSAGAGPGTVTVTVTHVRSAQGHVLVALCGRADFLHPHCPWKGKAPAAKGAVTITLTGVPAGVYAAQAFHDENDDGRLNRNFLGLPREGMGFSNDAPMHYGPPRFEAAELKVGADGASISVPLHYY